MGKQSKTQALRGSYVAVVTPFRADGSVDNEALVRMIEYVIEGGVDGIVPCGTTGEKSTLTTEEHKDVIARVVEVVNGRVWVVAGTGSNDTRAACEMASFARKVGADAGLSVVPYYNKPTQEGLIRHYCTIADRAGLPLVVYNVPSRTGGRINADTLLKLAEKCPLVHGLKDATNDLSFTAEVLRGRPEGFSVLSGDDLVTLPMIAMGADGVISVIANEVPARFSQMVQHALVGQFEAARAIFFELHPLMVANFIETNPIPVKAALAMMGLIGEHYRLPLCPMADANRERLRRILIDMALLPASR